MKALYLTSCLGLNAIDRLAYAAATVEIDENNGASAGTLTHGITNSNMSPTDEVNTDPVAHPVVPGANTMEKYQKIHVSNIGTSSKIDNLQVWRTGALGGAAVHKCNLKTSAYGGAPTYAQPVTTASSYSEAMPTSDPGAVNLGIGGALAGALTAAGSSDYLVHQIQTNAADTAGSTSTMNYQYDETA
jgi:hypothetical protein